MSSANSQIRSPYHLRSSSDSANKNPFTTVENSRIKKTIGALEKLSFPKTESDGYDTSRTKDTAGTEGLWGQFAPLSDEEVDKLMYETFDAKGVIYTPPVPLSEEEDHRMRNNFKLRLAQAGLSYLNDPAKQGPKYELVAPLGGGGFLSANMRIVYHSNFKAKLQNNPEAKTQLFFLEIVQTSPGQEKVTRCCSLGQSGSKAAVTGLNGCTVCKSVNHPKEGRFITRLSLV